MDIIEQKYGGNRSEAETLWSVAVQGMAYGRNILKNWIFVHIGYLLILGKGNIVEI